ncbi:TldD/PmbA family protein [bacterium]|nr:TldD/PmbA family protein [candidate division CSSED10-310 bacterium]
MHRRDFIVSSSILAGASVLMDLLSIPTVRVLAGDDPLVESFRSDPDNLADLLDTVLKGGAAYADVFLEQAISRHIRFIDGQLAETEFLLREGVAVRGIEGDRTVFAWSDTFRRDSARDAARDVRRSLHTGERRVKGQRLSRFPLQDFGAIITRKKLERTGDSELFAVLANIHSSAVLPSNLIVRDEIEYTDTVRRIMVATSEGRFVTDVQPSIDLMLRSTARQGSSVSISSRRLGHRCGIDFLQNPTVQHHARENAASAVENLSIRTAPFGRFPVVLAPRAAAALAQFWFHRILDPLAPSPDDEYPPHLRLVDNGRLQNGRGSCHIDDEGFGTKRSVFVENGRMIDRPALLNHPATNHSGSGHGFRPSYPNPPQIAPTNTVIESSLATDSAISRLLNRGIVITDMVPLAPDQSRSTARFTASSGWWIDSGNRQYPLAPFILSAPFPALLHAIDHVGSDPDLIPACYGTPPITVAFGAPTLRIAAADIRPMQETFS